MFTKSIQTYFAFAIILLIASGVGLWFVIEASKDEIEQEVVIPIAVRKFSQPVESELSRVDISGWKTYQNKEYGFEFKYPIDFMVDDSADESMSKFDIHLHVIKDGKNDQSEDLMVMKNYGVKDLDTAFNEYFNLKQDDFIPIYGKTNGLRTLSALTFEYGEHYIVVAITDNKSVVGFEAEKENEELLSKVISTFKFIN